MNTILKKQLNSLLSEKKFTFLRNILSEIHDSSEVSYLSSAEVQARYGSPAGSSQSDVEFLAENEVIYEINKKLWKRISSKDRRLLCQLVLLAEVEDWYLEFLKPIIKLNSDAKSREIMDCFVSDDPISEDRHEYIRSELIKELQNLSDNNRLYLARRIGDIKSSLSRGKISFQSLFQINCRFRSKNSAKRKIRHKGYRDHGTLRAEDRPSNWETGSPWEVRLYRKAKINFEDRRYSVLQEIEFYSQDCPSFKYWT